MPTRATSPLCALIVGCFMLSLIGRFAHASPGMGAVWGSRLDFWLIFMLMAAVIGIPLWGMAYLIAFIIHKRKVTTQPKKKAALLATGVYGAALGLFGIGFALFLLL